jgi:4-hydroxy-tetrahydrodipicolinate synthase
MGKDFVMLTGEDGNALEFNKKSGTGCISVTANVAAKLCSEMQNASLEKKNNDLQKRAEEINKILLPLNKALFIESNPSPVKYAASLLKLSSDEVRLPLVKITGPTKSAVKKALEHAHLI